MAVYAIGDVQGCYDELQALLKIIDFNETDDHLWFVGDLVNRGPKSLDVLRFIISLGDRAVTVLGNHDLHLLAVAAGCANIKASDTLDDILYATDSNELLDWLRSQPLIHHDDQLGYTMLHAGLPPQWDLSMAQACAREVEQLLRSDDYQELFKHMYGNKPDVWSDGLTGWGRMRFIINSFSRLRYCSSDGRLVLNEKGGPGTQAQGHIPWFEMPGRRSSQLKIVFGHWSTLWSYFRTEKGVNAWGVFPTDSGCVWGGGLTAIKLEDEPEYFNIDCPGACKPGEL